MRLDSWDNLLVTGHLMLLGMTATKPKENWQRLGDVLRRVLGGLPAQRDLSAGPVPALGASVEVAPTNSQERSGVGRKTGASCCPCHGNGETRPADVRGEDRPGCAASDGSIAARGDGTRAQLVARQARRPAALLKAGRLADHADACSQ